MKLFVIGILFSAMTFADSKITVSGISSGAYMAQQFHTAFSSQVSGAGIVAGGPYFCAKGKIVDALNRCMKTYLGLPTVKDSSEEAKKLEKLGKIDPISNMNGSNVYVISGTKDETVLQKVSDIAAETYKAWGAKVFYENKLAVGHAFPTDSFGNSCEVASQSPYISNCNRDVAGEILKHLLGNLSPKTTPKGNRYFTFDQLANFDGVEVDKLSMHKTGYAYVPEGCEFPGALGCRIHVAFHGCKQTLDDIQTTFVSKAGFNGWAEANKIVIIYPQAVKNMIINNPNGCWDWWGYTGADYHTKEGKQMRLVARLVEAFQNGKLQLENADL